MNSTSFWQIASLVMALVQFILYIQGFNNYRKRLEQLAENQRQRANEKFCAYKALRDKDIEFYAYYKTLPDYEECESNIQRAKGAAFYSYGSQMRRALPTVHGYLPFQRSAIANMLGEKAVYQTAMKRVQTKIAERSRVDDHLLERWQAIVSAPTNPSGTQDYSAIIESSFKSLQAFGQGANAALSQLGVSLYRIT